MEDWKDDHIRAINAKKMEGLNKLIYFLDYGNRTQPMFPKEYKILHIDYQSMQGLLDGSIRRSKDIKSSYNEIAMLYIDKGYNIIKKKVIPLSTNNNIWCIPYTIYE